MRIETWFGEGAGPDLVWGVRESFLRYVEAVGGIVEVTSPAQRREDGAMRFPFSHRTHNRIDFAGGVTYRAHHGALNVSLQDPQLERSPIDPHHAVLTAIDGSTALSSRIVLAAVDPTGNVTLAEDGVHLFDFHYAAGTALDPIRAFMATPTE